MITVLFLACQIASQTCQPVTVRGEMTKLYCELHGGQMAAADWIRAHPGFELGSRITCREGEAI